jgi:hypothetical protein
MGRAEERTKPDRLVFRAQSMARLDVMKIPVEAREPIRIFDRVETPRQR